MSAETVRQKKKAESERKADIYRHKGFEICRNFFLHLHSIGEKKLKIYSSKIKKMELKVGFTNQQKKTTITCSFF